MEGASSIKELLCLAVVFGVMAFPDIAFDASVFGSDDLEKIAVQGPEHSLPDRKPDSDWDSFAVELSEDQKTKLAAWEEDMKRKEQLISPRLLTAPPPGKSYEALVPDTLDLAERGALSLNCLTGMLLNPEHGYGLAQGTIFGANPPFLFSGCSSRAAQYLGDYLNVPKLTEALPEMRVMSGSAQNLDRERGLMLRLLATSWGDGLIHSPPVEGESVGVAFDVLIPRFLLGTLYWYQYDGNSLWLEHAHKIYRTIKAGPRHTEGERAVDFLEPGAQVTEGHGIVHGRGIVHALGAYILGLTKYSVVTGNAEALDMAGRLVRMLRGPRCWQPVDDPVGVVGEELGHSVRNVETHQYLFALRGLLEYAQATNDPELKRFVRSSYDYWRSFGIPEIGWISGSPTGHPTTETCAIADLVFLAVKMSDYGVGDYWEDVDQYVRNQLVAQQIIDKEQLVACAAASFPHQAKLPCQDSDHAIERSLGSFANGPQFVTYLPDPWCGPCCNHNGAQALYQAWEGIVRDAGSGIAQVNLLLNRASQQLDVDSYLPYEGKVILSNKTARRIHVRMPTWVSKADVRCHVGAKAVDNQWLENYLLFQNVKRGDRVTIEFPVVERTFRRTEGVAGITYTIRTRGNTVIDIQPRPELEPAKIKDGRLVVRAPAIMTVKGIAHQDLRVSVYARSTKNAGIVLRYTGPGDYVLAYYCRDRSSWPACNIAIYEMVGGVFRLMEKVQIEEMGPDIHLTAELKGPDAGFTVTDGAKTFGARCTLKGNLGAGSVGLYTVLWGTGIDGSRRPGLPPQSFGDFSVASADGRVIFEDGFGGSQGDVTPEWQVASLPNSYRFYLRDHLKGDKAPMVRKTRFVSDRIIKP